MKKIKILGALTHFKLKKIDGKEKCFHSAVDFYRIIQPLTHLPKDKFEVDIEYDMLHKFKTVEELTKHYDILFSSYIESDVFYVQLRVHGNNNNMTWVLDLDDNIWKVDPTHPYYEEYKEGHEKQFKRVAIIKDIEKMTVTNQYLRYQIVEHTGKPIKNISIMPNFIDLEVFDYKKLKPKERDEILIGYSGGSSHFPDINKKEFTDAMKIVLDKYPDVYFKTTFYMPQLKALFGYKYRYALGTSDIDKYINELWPNLMSETDIAVAPLSWSPYSRAKSYIKYLEMSAAKKPMVCERIDPYNEVLSGHEERGYLASSTEDWVKYLSALIESKDLRKKIGEEAYMYTKENHTIQKNIGVYSNYFESIIDKDPKKL